MRDVHTSGSSSISNDINGPFLRGGVINRIGSDSGGSPNVELHCFGVMLEPVGQLVFRDVNRERGWIRQVWEVVGKDGLLWKFVSIISSGNDEDERESKLTS